MLYALVSDEMGSSTSMVSITLDGVLATSLIHLHLRFELQPPSVIPQDSRHLRLDEQPFNNIFCRRTQSTSLRASHNLHQTARPTFLPLVGVFGVRNFSSLEAGYPPFIHCGHWRWRWHWRSAFSLTRGWIPLPLYYRMLFCSLVCSSILASRRSAIAQGVCV